MTVARKNQIDPASTCYYHCMARCVRHAFLCGTNQFSGKNHEHRRQWVVDRLAVLSKVFALGICSYAVMSNHYHVILHIDRKQGESWDTKTVLRRWTTLFSGPHLVQRFLVGDPLGKADLLRVEEYADKFRRRLLDISWFMRCLNEHLARKANEEDECTGRFWEGRYKSQPLLDEAALLTCMAYVDLNPVRAKQAETPESSEYTSIKQRISPVTQASNIKQPPHLKPFRAPGQNPDTAIPYTLSNYLELTDWTGRLIRKDKVGHIDASTPPILERLGIDPHQWLKTMDGNHRFRRVIGKIAALKAYAKKSGLRWVHGVTSSGCLYPSG